MSYKFTSRVLAFLCLNTFIILINSIKYPPNFSTNYPPPKVWLSEYADQDTYDKIPAEEEFKTVASYRNDFISKNGSDYVVYECASSIAFTCEATYPVKWIIPDMKQLLNVPIYTISSIYQRVSYFPPRKKQPINTSFKNVLQITSGNLNFLSANFTCISADFKQSPSASPEYSIHVFVANLFLLERQTEIVTLPVGSIDPDRESNKPLILPCRPAMPDLAVTLEKEVGDGWKIISSKFASFDAKVGFTLENIPKGKSILGLYRCLANNSNNGEVVGYGNDAEAVVYVKVTDDPVEESSPVFEPHLRAKGNASAYLNGSNLYNWDFVCCSGETDNLTKLYDETCDDPLQCEILKNAEFPRARKIQLTRYNDLRDEIRKDCQLYPMYNSPFLVECHGSNIDFEGEYVAVFNPNMAPVANRMEDWNTSAEATSLNNSLMIYKAAADIKIDKINEKIFIFIGHHIVESSIDYQHPYNTHLFNGKEPPEYTYSPDGEVIFKERTDRIMEYNRMFFYEGEPLRIICVGMKYFYGEKPYLAVNWENRAKSILEPDPMKLDKHIYLHGHYTGTMKSHLLVPLFTKGINASLEMKSVTCFMPILNGAEWDKLTYNLTVKPSFLPKFKGDEKETVYFYLHDRDMKINCEMAEGLPKPEVNVTKNGKPLNKQLYETNLDEMESYHHQNGSYLEAITIPFKAITYEIHGTYQCIAENVKGRATRTIIVIVSDKRSILLPASLVIIALLSALLITIGVKYRLQLKDMWRLRNSLIR